MGVLELRLDTYSFIEPFTRRNYEKQRSNNCSVFEGPCVHLPSIHTFVRSCSISSARVSNTCPEPPKPAGTDSELRKMEGATYQKQQNHFSLIQTTAIVGMVVLAS